MPNNHLSILSGIHLMNALWISKIIWLGWNNKSREINYLIDPVLITLLIFCAALNFARWRQLATERLDKLYSSGIALRQDMEQIARVMYGGIPYLISPIPSQALLQCKADSLIANDSGFTVLSKGNLMLAVLNVDGLISVHFFCLFLFSFGLYASNFERFANIFRVFWPLQSIFAIIAAGLLIYSAVTIMFSIVFNRERG